MMFVKWCASACVGVAVLILVAHAPAMAASDGPMVKVPLDVDVYDKPNGKGKPRNESLRSGSTVELLKENGTHWCNVQGEAVPGGPGWIWCGIGDDGKDYKLIKMGGSANDAGSGGDAQPIKSDCKIIGPNEGAGGGSSDPTVTYKCVDIGDGKKECCFYKQP